MRLVRILLAVIVGLFAAFPHTLSSAALPDINHSDTVCGIFIGSLALHLGTNPITRAETMHPVFPIALNDILCETEENMANIALMARKENSDGYFYGIFHVHFRKDGRIISSTPLFDWVTVRNINDPTILQEWCELIKNDPNELQKHLCN